MSLLYYPYSLRCRFEPLINKAVSVKWYLRKPDWNLGEEHFFHSGREVVEVQPFPLPWKWMEDYWLDRNFYRPNQVQVFSGSFWKTTAVLQFSGMWPLRRERFTISVIGGANTSRQDFSSHVGTGSSRQEALEDSRTISDTSSMDSAEKLSRFSLGVTGMSLETCQDFPLWFQFFWGRCQIRLLALWGQCTLEEPSKVVPYTKN